MMAGRYFSTIWIVKRDHTIIIISPSKRRSRCESAYAVADLLGDGEGVADVLLNESFDLGLGDVVGKLLFNEVHDPGYAVRRG